MSMNGEYMSMAEACGEKEPSGIAWIPGENFDPYDEDEMETMNHIWEGERFEYVQRLEEENARLREMLGE